MGVYFIVTGPGVGGKSKNREKSLDKPYIIDQLRGYLNSEDVFKLEEYFEREEKIYIWGANKRSFRELKNVSKDEYVVDVYKKQVIQIFTFCFYIETKDRQLQNYIGWDAQRQKEDQKPYPYVFFLKNPCSAGCIEKEYFQDAFEKKSSHWLDEQKWFSNSKISLALQKTSAKTVEQLLGIKDRNYFT